MLFIICCLTSTQQTALLAAVCHSSARKHLSQFGSLHACCLTSPGSLWCCPGAPQWHMAPQLKPTCLPACIRESESVSGAKSYPLSQSPFLPCLLPVPPQLCLLTLLVWGIAQDLYLVTLLASRRWSQFLRGLPASSPGEKGKSERWQVEVCLDAWWKAGLPRHARQRQEGDATVKVNRFTCAC